MSVVDWSIQQATLTTAQIAASSYVPLTGQLVWNSQTGQYKIGDGATALSALTYYGGRLTIGSSTITSGTNTNILYNNAGVLGEYTLAGTGTVVVMATSPTLQTNTLLNQTTEPQYILTVNNSATARARFGMVAGSFYLYGDDASAFNLYTNTVVRYTCSATGQNTWTPGATTSGLTTGYIFTNPSHTGQTASTAVKGWDYSAFSRTWANAGGTNTISEQIENNWAATTYAISGGGTLTFTNAYGNFFNRPTASGVTITNAWALGTGGAAKFSVGSSGASLTFAAGAGTTMLCESNTTNYITFLQPNANVGGFIWGAPTDGFGALVRWGGTQNKMEIGTATASGTLEFLTGNAASTILMSGTDLTLSVNNYKITSTGTGSSGMILKNQKNSANTTVSGTVRTVEIDIGGTPYYFLIYPTSSA